MFDLSAINEAKKKASVNQEKTTGDYEKVLHEGISLYESFCENNDELIIKAAADKFGEALSLKRSQPESYLFLAMIFNLFEEDEKALEYFAAAKELSAEKPEYRDFLANVEEALLEKVA